MSRVKKNYKNKLRFVIICNPKLGDTLLVNTLAHNIKTIFPNSFIIALTIPELLDSVKLQPYIDDAVSWDRKGQHRGILGTFKFILKFPYKNLYAAIPIFGQSRAVILSVLLNPKYILVPNIKSLLCQLFKRTKYPILHESLDMSITKSFSVVLSGITKEPIIDYPVNFTVSEKYLLNELWGIKGKYVVLSPVSAKESKNMPIEN